MAASWRSKSSRSLVCWGSWARKSFNGMSNLPPFSAVIFCSSPSQSALTALRYCWTASLLLDDGAGAGDNVRWTDGCWADGCWADEQAATRTQPLTATAMARISPTLPMIGATELTLRFRSHFVAQPIYRRYGVSGLEAPLTWMENPIYRVAGGQITELWPAGGPQLD